jgi:hypothetical protein
MNHHEFSPSKLEQFRLCPGSYQMQKGLPDTTSPAAEEGTLLHAAVANNSTEGLNSEQTTAVESCLNYLDSITCDGDDVFPEIGIKLFHLDTNDLLTEGTADVIKVSRRGELDVIDWKFGYTPVNNVSNNIQLATYAAGAMLKFGFNKCNAHVFQPRIKRFSTYTFTDFNAIVRNVQNIIKNAQSYKIVLNATDDSCRYCKARLNCPAFRMKYQKLAASSTKYDLNNPNILEELYEVSRDVKTFINEIENKMKQTIEEQGSCGKYVFDIKDGAREIKNLNRLYSVVKDYLTPQEFNDTCKVTLGKLESALAEKFIAAEAILGNKLTKTDAKKKCYDMLSELVSRGNPTKTIVAR